MKLIALAVAVIGAGAAGWMMRYEYVVAPLSYTYDSLVLCKIDRWRQSASCERISIADLRGWEVIEHK